MKKEINSENNSLDSLYEFWREQKPDEEDEPYFPIEESKPPHY